jgi:hypothetical protein
MMFFYCMNHTLEEFLVVQERSVHEMYLESFLWCLHEKEAMLRDVANWPLGVFIRRSSFLEFNRMLEKTLREDVMYDVDEGSQVLIGDSFP